MRRLLLVILSLIAAALVAPITFLLLAAALDRLGWRGFATEVERFPFRTSGHNEVVLDIIRMNEASSLVPWIAAIVIGLIFVLFLALFLRIGFAHTRGAALVMCWGLATIPVYGYLGWDEAPMPTAPEQLESGRETTHVPREVVLEGTSDPTYGHAKEWPKNVFESHKEPPTNAWLLDNADQIRAHWAELEPIRSWAAKLDNWTRFDDYMYKLTDPLLMFQPLRQLTFGAQEYALLCVAENKPEEAAATIAANIRLARHLEQGGRALVTLMIGVVIEKYALRTVGTLCERSPDQRKVYLSALDAAPIDPWSDFERTLSNEVILGGNSIREEYSGGKTLQERTMNCLDRVLINPNATTRVYHDYVEDVLADAKHGDFETFKSKKSDPKSDVSRYHFKNPTGCLLARQAPVMFGKVAQSIAEVAKLRSDLANP